MDADKSVELIYSGPVVSIEWPLDVWGEERLETERASAHEKIQKKTQN